MASMAIFIGLIYRSFYEIIPPEYFFGPEFKSVKQMQVRAVRQGHLVLTVFDKPFYGKVSADGFKLRSTRVSTRNSWSPQVVGRVKAGSRENTCLVEFSFDLPTSIKIASPLVFLSFLVVLIALLPELTSPGKAVFLLFQFLFLATIIPLSLYMGLRLGKKDKQHILEYFQNLPGAKLSVQKRLIE